MPELGDYHEVVTPSSSQMFCNSDRRLQSARDAGQRHAARRQARDAISLIVAKHRARGNHRPTMAPNYPISASPRSRPAVATLICAARWALVVQLNLLSLLRSRPPGDIPVLRPFPCDHRPGDLRGRGLRRSRQGSPGTESFRRVNSCSGRSLASGIESLHRRGEGASVALR